MDKDNAIVKKCLENLRSAFLDPHTVEALPAAEKRIMLAMLDKYRNERRE